MTDPINIVTDQIPGSGIGMFATSLFRLLRDKVRDLRLVFLPYYSTALPDDAPAVIRTASARSPWEVPFKMRQNERLFLANRALAEEPAHLLGASYGLARRPGRTIATVHDFYIRQLSPSLIRNPSSMAVHLYISTQTIISQRDLARCERVVSVSNATRHDLRRKSGIDSLVIHHWIEADRFHPRPRESCRLALGLPKGRRILLNVSVSGTNKGLPLLKRAIEGLPREYLLVKVGCAVPSEGQRVLNVGRVDQQSLPLYYCAADAYIHTSSKEGFCIPLIEAMGSQLPVVSRSTPEAHEVLDNAGVYVDGNTPESFADSIRSLESSEKVKTLSVEMTQRASAFSRETAAERYLQLYAETFGPHILV